MILPVQVLFPVTGSEAEANPMTPFPGGRTDSGTHKSISLHHLPAPDTDDRQFARVLILMWSLASGRRPRLDVPPDHLTEDELVAFWADDFERPSGRHARPDSSPVEAA